MTYARSLSLTGALLLGACTFDKDLLTTGDDPATESGASGTTEAADPTDTGGTTGAPLEGAALCAAQTDRGSCEAVDFPQTSEGGAWCFWLDWTPVTLDGDVCTFGAPQGKCHYESFSEGGGGCATYEVCGVENVSAAWKKEGDVVSLAYGTFCVLPPEGSFDCSPDYPPGEVAPECACTCKPEFSPEDAP